MTFTPYDDWVALSGMRREHTWRQADKASCDDLRGMVLEALDVDDDETVPQTAAVHERWEADGVAGELLSWDVGYGPRTEAYLLKPSAATRPMPGVVALHCHSGFKWYGKEKIADGALGQAPGVEAIRAELYGGTAYANELAKSGFVVLVHDVFMWGSRRFILEEPFESSLITHQARIDAYNDSAARHEHVVEKYCRLLGTTVAAIVAREDRAAVGYLAGRPEVRGQRIGCIGLSGGGLRAGMLQATSSFISASVIVAMMATYGSLLKEHVACHTWMLFPAGWTERGDWPDLVACRPDVPLLVQYDDDDPLFPREGMYAAHERLQRRYSQSGLYDGYFYPGGHKFDRPMQKDAFAWLHRRLSGPQSELEHGIER